MRPADVKVGDDTRSSVLTKLGSPTATSTFDKDVWFYMSQFRTQTSFYDPKTIQRDITAISFDHDTAAGEGGRQLHPEGRPGDRLQHPRDADPRPRNDACWSS